MRRYVQEYGLAAPISFAGRPLRLVLLLSLWLAGPAGARADDVDDCVKAEMQKQRIPGLSLAVVREGKIVKAAGYGLANVELNVPATPETVYPLASIGKQFIATGIMLLVQEGKVDIDEKLSKYLDGTPESWKDITLYHLLTHTSGMVRDDSFSPQSTTTEGEMFRWVAQPLNSPPGERFAYSNTGFNLLGMVIRKVSGQPWDEFLKERIFVPLGMSATRTLNPAAVIPNRAGGYLRSGGELRNAPPQARAAPAGGLLTTVTDLAKWDAALYTEEPLKAASRKLMWTPGKLKEGAPPPKMPRAGGYGFGWSVSQEGGHKVIGHGGMRPGGSSYLARYVDDKLTVIVMVNISDMSAIKPAAITSAVAACYIPELKKASTK